MYQKIFQQVTWKKTKKTGFNGYICDFSVDYNVIDADNIKDIHKYLMKKNDIIYKTCSNLLSKYLFQQWGFLIVY